MLKSSNYEKSYLDTCSAVLFCVSTGFAQAKKDLKGPKAKNHKVWQDDTQSSAVVFNPNKQRLTGPKAKNQKPWEKYAAKQDYIAVTSSKRQKVTGPRAKNWKPWRKSEREDNIQYAVKSTDQKSAKSPAKLKEEK